MKLRGHEGTATATQEIRLHLVEDFGEDFNVQPPGPSKLRSLLSGIGLDAKGGVIQYDAVFVQAPKGSVKGIMFKATNLPYGIRAVPIVISNLRRRQKNAVVISEDTWGDGNLYKQLNDPNDDVSFTHFVYLYLIFPQTPKMHIQNVEWEKTISNCSFRERFKLLVYDEAIEIAEWRPQGPRRSYEPQC
ncbi:BQ2448_1945 [Microbotryum intermedium]|uniref:BQ2448_1945 protein n=1 Tax=Microbotryum intermedium TaxID=269621 RepID=A0A238F6W1_9BASI|nr:BQ2448_1945 [Microbotryum intermedium]